MAGTFELGRTADAPGGGDLPWWHPWSTFGTALGAAGLPLADESEPFIWSTELNGLVGEDNSWHAGGSALRYFAHWKVPPVMGVVVPVSLIAHSHGGQVALIAAAQGLIVDTLVTLGTPVRRSLGPIRVKARPNITHWMHVFSPNDPVQLEGEIGGGGGPFSWPRSMPEADVNALEPTQEPGAHGKLLDPALWTARGWWEWLREFPIQRRGSP